MGTYHFTIESIVRELRSVAVEAEDRQSAIARMKAQINADNFDASWHYSDTLVLRLVDVEDPQGAVTSLDGLENASVEQDVVPPLERK